MADGPAKSTRDKKRRGGLASKRQREVKGKGGREGADAMCGGTCIGAVGTADTTPGPASITAPIPTREQDAHPPTKHKVKAHRI